MEELDGWKSHYEVGALIDFDFTQPLALDRQVREICDRRGWAFESIPGDLSLLQRWLDGDWTPDDFLVVPPGQTLVPSYDDTVISATPTP